MTTIVDVGHKVAEVAEKLQWERVGQMEYSTIVSGHMIVVTKTSFQVWLNGNEIDAFSVDYGDAIYTTWIDRLWRHAHEAVLDREGVFEELLRDLDVVDQFAEEQD